MKAITLRFLFVGALFTPIIERLTMAFHNNFSLIIIVGVMMALDTASGVYAAYRSKEATSKKFWLKFFDKFVAYNVLMILFFFVFVLTQESEAYHLDIEYAEHLISYPLSVMMVREFWSIGENVNKIIPGLFDKFKELFKFIKK